MVSSVSKCVNVWISNRIALCEGDKLLKVSSASRFKLWNSAIEKIMWVSLSIALLWIRDALSEVATLRLNLKWWARMGKNK